MERENRPPEELTRPGLNTYSRSMPETGDIPAGGGAPEPPRTPMGDIPDPAFLDDLLARDDVPTDMRGFAEQLRATAQRQRARQQGGGEGQRRGRAQTDDIDQDAARSVLDESTFSEMGQKELEANKASIIKSLEKPRTEEGRYFKSSEVADPVLKEILQKAERLHIDSVRRNDPELLKELKKALDEFGEGTLTDEQRTQSDNIFQHLEALQKVIYIDAPLGEEQARYTFRLTLTESDFDDINEDPLNWMQRQMDRVYTFSKQGSEMNSPQVSAAQSLVQTAQRYMILSKWGREDPEMVQRFGDEFSFRLQVMFQAGTIGRKNMEGAKGLAQNIGVHGILSTLTFEEGLVNKMHNRMADLYDDMRLKMPGQHVTADMHATLRNRLINEFQGYLSQGINVAPAAQSESARKSSEVRKQDLARDQIIRAVGAAFDHFAAAQRQAVIVSRGTALSDFHTTAEGLIADPSALFQAFNIEQMLIAKFGLLNESQEKFYNALKRRYAENTLKEKGIDFDQWANDRAALDPSILHKFDEHGHAVTVGEEGHEKPVLYTQKELTVKELERYGGELMKDLMLVNDFYSSPWRMKAFFRQMEDVVKYNHTKAAYLAEHPEAENSSTKKLTKEASVEIGRRMSHLSPGELAQIGVRAKDFGLFMRLRDIHKGGPGSKEEVFQQIAKYKPEDVVKIFRSIGYPSELKEVNAMFEQNGISVEPTHGGEHDEHGTETHYDVFKEKYGGVMRLMREHGFSQANPEQIDLSELLTKPQYLEIFNKAMNESEGSTAEAQKFVNIMQGIKNFAKDEKTILKLTKDQRFEGIYSRSYSVDDALLDKLEVVDENAGMRSLSQKLGPEPGGDAYARTFNDAEAAAQAGVGLVKFLRDKSFDDKVKDSLEIAELVSHYGGPGDRARVFRRLGAEMMLMGNIEDNDLGLIYELMDMKKKPFNKPINELQEIFGIHAPAYNREDLFHFVHEYEPDLVGSGPEAEKLFHEVEMLARVTPKNRTEMIMLRLAIYFSLYALLEGVYDLKEGLNSPELSGGGGHH